MKELELLTQEEFRAWFTTNFRDTDLQLTKMFEEFDYDGQDYVPKRLETKEETGRRSSKG